MSDSTGTVGWQPKIKYPENDAATKLADDVEKSLVKDGKSKTNDTYEAFKKQDTVVADLADAAKVAGTFGYQMGKTVVFGDAVETYKAVELGAKSLYNYATGKPGAAIEDATWFLAKKLLKSTPVGYFGAKGIDGTIGLIKTYDAAKGIGDAKTQKLLQVFHNERVQIDVNRYLADRGMIAKTQYDASLKGMSPLAEHYAKGNGSPIDEHAAAFAAKAKATGADKLIAADFRQGKVAAVRFEIKTAKDVDAAMAQSADFKKAYTSNAAFRAGVDALVDEYAHESAKYQKDVAELSSPPPPPVKG